MKKIENTMIRNFAFIFWLIPSFVAAQQAEEVKPEKVVEKPVKSTFAGNTIINNQTVMTMGKNGLEFMIQHRFGKIEGESNMFGFFDPANIRFGCGYGVLGKLSVGLGVTKYKHVYDLNMKYALLKQTKSGKIPVSVTYYGETMRSGKPDENFTNHEGKYKANNRYSYFNELIVGRKFNDHFSLQAAFTYSYYNIIQTGLKNGTMGVSAASRYKFTNQTSLIFDFDYPLTQHTDKAMQPKPNVGLGVEIATSGHHFQVFVCTSDGILGPETRVLNQNDWSKKEIIIGFNINRLWSF